MDTDARGTYDIDIHARQAWAFRDAHSVNIVSVDTACRGPNVYGFTSVGYRMEWCICRVVVVAVIAGGIFTLKFVLACFLWIPATVRNSSRCPRKLNARSQKALKRSL